MWKRNALSREVLQSIRKFVIEGTTDNLITQDGLSFEQFALRKQKFDAEENAMKFMDTRFLLPSSNISERLFSQVGHTISDRR